MRSLELAIKYLAGDRLIGTAAERLALTTGEPDYEVGTESTGLTTDPSWTNVSGSNVSYDATNDELDVNPSGNNYGANTGYYIDLNAQITGSISETAWVLRFKFIQQTWTENTGTSGLNSVFLALQSSTNPSSNHDYVSTGIHNYSSEPQGWFFRGQENTGNNNPVGNSTLVLTPSASTTYWGEIKRVSATSVECRFYTNANFTGTPAGSTTDTITSGLNGLQYLSIWGLMQTNAGTNYNNVSFKWFKFYNGVTSAPSLAYPNLPNGAIFEESSTGKHYMFDGTSAWNEM